MKYKKTFTWKEWKKFDKPHSAEPLGNTVQFVNYFTQSKKFNYSTITDEQWESGMYNHIFRNQEKESYDFLTVQEILLQRYKITLTNYIQKKFIKVRYPNQKLYHLEKYPEMCPIPTKEKLKTGLINLPSKITQENFDKGMKKFDKGIDQFNKAVETFSGGLGDGKSGAIKNKKNLYTLVGDIGKSKNTEKIWGDKKKKKSNSLRIWSEDEPKTRKKSRKKTSKSNDMDKIWGKK